MTTYIMLGTHRGLPETEKAVTASTGASFPAGFGTNAVDSATDEIAIVVNTTNLKSRQGILNAIEKIKKAIIQDPVMNTYFTT